jgi:RimJ/RimL family protein N-acetyltransferase
VPKDDSPVWLAPVDEQVLALLVTAATSDASPNEVTPPVPPGNEWVPARIEWLRSFHRDRRSGLDGPAAEASWAVVADGDVVGAIRLKRIDGSDAVEVGLWLTRSVRGRGLGRRAVAAALQEARAAWATAVRADTTAGNRGAIALLEALGFDCTPVEGDAVIAWRALDGSPQASERSAGAEG